MKERFGLQMVAEPDFNEHLYKFNKITVELDSLELKNEEEDKALLVFVLLPSSFDGIMTTYSYVWKRDLEI